MKTQKKCFFALALFLVNLRPSFTTAEEKKPPSNTAASATNSTKTITGFQDINWGDSVATVRKKMFAKKQFKPLPSDNEEEMLFYTGGTLGGQSISIIGFDFSKEGFFKATAVFDAPQHEVLRQYKDIKDLLTQKYGQPERDVRKFKEPYSEGDGDEEQAVRSGKGLIYSMWSFPNKGKEEDDVLGLQVKELDGELSVELVYENGARQKRRTQKAQKKNSNEF